MEEEGKSAGHTPASIKSLLAYNYIKQLVYMQTTVQVLYSIKKCCVTDGGCFNTEHVRRLYLFSLINLTATHGHSFSYFKLLSIDGILQASMLWVSLTSAVVTIHHSGSDANDHSAAICFWLYVG